LDRSIPRSPKERARRIKRARKENKRKHPRRKDLARKRERSSTECIDALIWMFARVGHSINNVNTGV
jgi:hypothetical protein